MRDYEITFVLTSTLDEETSAATVERVNQLIANGGGQVTEVHAWGRRRLAYPIEHQRDGFYVTTRFALQPASVAALDNDLRLNESILRHIIVRQDEVPPLTVLPTQPQAVPTSATAPRAAEISAADGAPDLVEGLDDEYIPDAEE